MMVSHGIGDSLWSAGAKLPKFRTIARSRRKRPWHLVYASGMTWCGQKAPEKTFTMPQDDLPKLRNLCVNCRVQLVAERLAG